mmetsp:Transcript_21207/g.20369  ORF Transcript_21207/g.20369 Transcript_21207/m.20369 type:complete len:206 (+) Transcript_21207:251-868(+)
MCRTNFSNPPLNDGRDLFTEILKSEWKIAKKLYEIVQYIPEFITEVKIGEEEMRVYGCFHLGYLYDLREWQEENGVNKGSKLYPCDEQDEAQDELFYQRKLVLSQTAILIFEPQKNIENMGMLVSWATLQSLDKLRRNLARPGLISFIWRQIEGEQPWVLNLFIPEYEDCLADLVKNMKNMGVGVEKNVKNQTKIKESEVTKEAI